MLSRVSVNLDCDKLISNTTVVFVSLKCFDLDYLFKWYFIFDYFY